MSETTRDGGVPEAELVEVESGLEPGDGGWFVVNVKDATWHHCDAFGGGVIFEGSDGSRPGARFEDMGINIHVLEPGKPNCMYHREDAQEAFLVLSGECVLLVEGEERRLRAWDFVHFPKWTDHVVVGVEGPPCAVLMIGSRREGDGIVYPVSELALSHGAGVPEETPDPKVAYAPFPPWERRRPGLRGLPWEAA